MKQYILGRDGTQLFKIPENRIRVSHRHAKLTVNDDGRWILEDLNSGNGTYIITDDGELMKVKHMVIGEITRIILGDQTTMGFTFIAHHVLEDDPNDYRTEFRHVLDIYKKALTEKAAIDEKTRRKANLRFIPSIISAVTGLALTFALPQDMKPYGVSFTMLITALLTVYFNKMATNNKELQKFNAIYSKKLTCPCCGKLITDAEYKNQMCAACKTRA